jgi:hypothetical protein
LRLQVLDEILRKILEENSAEKFGEKF